MKHKKNIFGGEKIANLGSSLLAIVCGLLFGLIILLISNPKEAFGGFAMIGREIGRASCRERV